MVAIALKAAENLSARGIDCRVVSMPTLKPLDEEVIIRAAAETNAVVTVEEHLEHGGLGSRVAQVVGTHRAVPMSLVAIKDTFAKSGSLEILLENYGLSATDIEQAVCSTIARKQKS
jgi:transketolase